MTANAPTVFESFNARNLSPAQVAAAFIPPPTHFDDLILRRHSLVIGPRGSGKTTLLKMLQLPALAAWEHPKANEYRASIDFIGVFVAADVSWGAQLSLLGHGNLSASMTRLFGQAAFTTHVFLALIEAMQESASSPVDSPSSIANKYFAFTKEQEAELCLALAGNWLLSCSLPTFNALRLALRERLSLIARIARQELVAPSFSQNADQTQHDFFYIGFLEAVIFAIEAFNGTINRPQQHWALMFDELEIAPAEIRRTLFTALRSTDHRLLFKLSMSPYNDDARLLESSTSAMSGDDYQKIELWYPRKEEGYKFSEALLKSMLEDSGVEQTSSRTVFGASIFDAGDQERSSSLSAYRPGTRLHKRFDNLARRDKSFKDYLARNAIDINAMHLLSESERAAAIRKGTSIVAVREHYRSSVELQGAPTRVSRSRKASTLYTGDRALFAIIEGNPRWFIGIVGPLLRSYASDRSMVVRSTQARAITVATNRFRALLKTIPYTPPTSSSSRGLLSLLDVIGSRFHENVVSGEFNPDPPLSFIVDSTASPEMLTALGKALNAGAIILAAEQGGETLLSSLRGKRFRLSYMLAPGYGLPLTLGRPAALSQMFERPTSNHQQLRFYND